MNIHKNARLTPLSRADLVRRVVVEGQSATSVAAAFGISVRTATQVDGPLRGRGNGRSAGPLVAAASPVSADAGCHRREGGSAAPPAVDRQADRRRTGHLAGHGQPHPQAPRPQPYCSAGAGRTGPPLRAGEARRADPHRHQEAWPLRTRRPPHHRRSPAGQLPRRRLGVRSCLDRRRLATGLLADPARREEASAVAFLQRRRRLLPEPRRHRRPGDDRQRLMLSLQSLPRGLPRSRPQAHPDQALHPEDQRQGRALHPDRLARMGLCPSLSELGSSAPKSCPSGSTDTTGIDRTAV